MNELDTLDNIIQELSHMLWREDNSVEVIRGAVREQAAKLKDYVYELSKIVLIKCGKTSSISKDVYKTFKNALKCDAPKHSITTGTLLRLSNISNYEYNIDVGQAFSIYYRALKDIIYWAEDIRKWLYPIMLVSFYRKG